MCQSGGTCDSQLAEGGSCSIVTSEGPARCRKCTANAYIVMDRIHFECKDCFLETCQKKLRSTIGRSKLLRNKDSILLAHSTGPSSTCMLDLVKRSIESDPGRSQKFRPSILHIHTQSIINQTTAGDGEANLMANLHRLKERYPEWPIYWTRLEYYTDDDNSPPIHRYPDPATEQSLSYPHATGHQKMVQEMNARDLTDRQEFVHNRCMSLINRAATIINSSIDDPNDQIKFVFVGSTATRLANNLLVDVILGHGATIHSTVNVCDRRPSVPIVRPMREFSQKEIGFYLRARGLECDVKPNLLTFAERKASIQTVTEAFLSKLYVDYPSTYNTLLRTGNKMQD